MKIEEKIVKFLGKQGYVIVSTIDEDGRIHCSAKGIVGIDESGKVFVIDLFHNKTYQNLTRNSMVSITAVDEMGFVGFTLQGKAKIVPREEIKEHLMKKWEDKIIQRISTRMIKNVQKGVKSKRQFEADLPSIPKYLIEIDVENIVDLTQACKAVKQN